MLIRKDNTNKVSANFTEAEYYKASFGTNGDPFDLSDKVINGGQIIRTYFGVPMKVNASYRTSAWDISKGRSGTGQHTKKTATDFSFVDNGNTMLNYHQEILQKGPLYKELRKAGINGFGLYDNFLHIDSRPGGSTPDSEFGPFSFWDNRTWTKKKKEN